MDSSIFGLLLFVLGFVLLDLAALRFGVDSRSNRGDRPNWW